MNINWLSDNDSKSAITIYQNNIVLNKQASDFFKNSYMVAIGINSDNNSLVIKSVEKNEADKYSQLYKINFTKSYGRINGKVLVDSIKGILGLDFTQSLSFKFSAKYNTGLKMLIAETGGFR